MSNPDIKISTVDSLTSAIPISILFLILILVLFQFRDSIPSFKLILWIAFPIFCFFTVAIVNVILQYVSCKTTNVGKAILGALPTLGTILLGLGISSISYCRIPIASVFAPLLIGQTIDITKNKSTMNINTLKNSNSKECCIPKFTLSSVESNFPIINGISYGFYIIFSTLYGMVIGTGISTIC